MKEQLRACILKGIEGCFADGTLTSGTLPAFTVEKPGNPEHGDFATNAAMQMAKQERKAPRAVAEIIINKLAGSSDLIGALEIAGPGFINFRIKDSAWRNILVDIDRGGDKFGKSKVGAGKKVQ